MNTQTNNNKNEITLTVILIIISHFVGLFYAYDLYGYAIILFIIDMIVFIKLIINNRKHNLKTK